MKSGSCTRCELRGVRTDQPGCQGLSIPWRRCTDRGCKETVGEPVWQSFLFPFSQARASREGSSRVSRASFAWLKGKRKRQLNLWWTRSFPKRLLHTFKISNWHTDMSRYHLVKQPISKCTVKEIRCYREKHGRGEERIELLDINFFIPSLNEKNKQTNKHNRASKQWSCDQAKCNLLEQSRKQKDKLLRFLVPFSLESPPNAPHPQFPE